MNLETATLNDVERAYRDGRLSRAEAAAYLRLWNAGPHFTQAILAPDGYIRNYDPETHAAFLRPYVDEFGVRL